MKRFYNSIIFSVAAILLLVVGCGEKTPDKDYVIPKDKPVSALTIGWYVPAEILNEIVGNNFRPKIDNQRGKAEIMLVIAKGYEHYGDGIAAGLIKTACLLIPVEIPDTLTTPDETKIENAMVCPLTVVEKSAWLGNKFDEYGFKTYSGQIDLDIEQTDQQKYLVKVTIKTANGQIEINSMFEEESKSVNTTTAVFTAKPGLNNYFYGDAHLTRISNGKGNLKTDGQNIISAMNLNGQPYFLKFDHDYSWAFDFVRK